MRRHIFRASGAIISLSFFLLCFKIIPSAEAQVNGSPLGASGTVWGGQHVELEVTPAGATLEFDCASGFIAKPLQLDAQGKFKVAGTFSREHPGPVIRDGPGPAPATYSGSVQNGTMKLTIAVSQGENLGEYMLFRGKPGLVMKCR